MYAIIHPLANLRAGFEGARELFSRRALAWEIAKHEIVGRYTDQLFGVAWAVGHPLSLIALYAFIFSFLMQVRLGDSLEMPLDFTAYLMTGLIPWMMSQETMGRSCSSITSNANLVKQVVFRLELLPVAGVVVAAITAVVALLCLVVYTLATGQPLFWTFLLLPCVLTLHVMFLIGLGFILAAVSVFFRDLKDFVQLFNIAGLFLAPIVYLPTSIPWMFKPIIYANPFSYVIWCYRDILYYGRFEHLWAWPVFAVGSLVTFALGYRTFRKLSPYFGNLL